MSVLGVVTIAVWIIMLAFSPRIARHGVSLLFSEAALAATSGPYYVRVRRMKRFAYVTSVAFCVGMIYVGFRFLGTHPGR